MLNRHMLLFASLVAMLLTSVSFAANIQGPRRSALQKLQEGDAVRNRLLLRDGRFEIAPTLGFTLNDAYRRNALFGVDLAYNLSDTFAIGGGILMGLSYDSALAERLKSIRGDRVSAGGFSDVGLLAALEVSYTPLFGKVAFMGRKVLNYDFQVSLGAGAANLSGSTSVEGLAPVAVVGAGLRLFTDRWMAVTFEVRDYLYSSALNAVYDPDGEGDAQLVEESVRNNFAFTVGYSFLFPKVPKVSD